MNLKTIDLHYDFVVSGGGISGICCAVAAARSGLHTALVEDRSILGGNSSSEIRVPASGMVAFTPFTMETGIIEEILLLERAVNDNTDYFCGNVNPAYDRALLEFVLKQQNLDLYLNTSIYSADISEEIPNRRINALYGLCTMKGLIYRFSAEQFADCTGDGVIAYLSGASFAYGRESRSTYKERLAPLEEDLGVLGSTLLFTAKRTACPQKFTPPKWAKKITAKDIGSGRDLGYFGAQMMTGYWWMELAAPYHTIEDADQIRDELLAYLYGIWDFIKNNPESGRTQQAENFVLDWVGMIPGKRESRRFFGEILLTENDCRNPFDWPDAVATAGWYLDIHIPEGVRAKDQYPEPSHGDPDYRHYTLVEPYSIPLRSLYSRDVLNLWLGGRCISVSHIALSSVRVQCTLGNLGQAIGTAAFFAIKQNLMPKELWCSSVMKQIQQTLLKDDVRILNHQNQDPLDLLQNATVTASHNLPLTLDDIDLEHFEPLILPRGQVFPVSQDRVENVLVYLRNNGEQTVIKASLFALNHIWDQKNGILLNQLEVAVPENFEGFINLPFGCDVPPCTSSRVALDRSPNVSWARSLSQPIGTLAQYYYHCDGKSKFLKDQIELPAYSGWFCKGTNGTFSHAMSVIPESYPYSGDNVVNGCAWPENFPNLWKTRIDSNDSWLELLLNKPTKINTVMLYFDTDLNLQHAYLPPLCKQPCCPADYRLLARIDGAFKEIYSCSDNYLRYNIARFDTVETDALRLKIIKSNTDDLVDLGIYEMRAYFLQS